MDINENSIRERAHWLWKQAGSPQGQDMDFWLEAENALKQEAGTVSYDSQETEESADNNPNNFSPTPWGTQS